MPTARQPAPGSRDRAERHVFERLPELPAVERRVLALVEVLGLDRGVVARDVGIEEGELGLVASRARRALRRTVAPLAGGSRCSRAEELHSDALDGVGLERMERKWLDIHLSRCPRCESHVALLEEARVELRASFLPAPAEVAPVEAEGDEGRARLRVVPEPAAETEEADAPPAVGGIRRPTADKGSPRDRRVAIAVAVVLVLAVLLAAIVLLLSG